MSEIIADSQVTCVSAVNKVEFDVNVFSGIGYGTYGWTGPLYYSLTSFCLI